jgi:GSH-dependent disulfide-bond oxidoreductase
MSIELYTWGTPNGKKISIALEEMGLAYNVHPVNIGKDEQFAPDFLKISPNNKIPAIVDTDNGQSVFESGAILMYLGDKSGKFYPQELARRIKVNEWLMWQMGGFGPMLGRAHAFLQFNPGKAPFAEDMFAKEAQRLYGVLDTQLGKTEFMAGEYSIADMATFPWAARHEWQRVDLNAFPHVLRWYKAIAARPAVIKGYDVPGGGAAIPMLKEAISA